MNDVIARSFASAGIPVAKEPTGIYRDRRSDSLHTCSRGCQSQCSDSMLSFCMTAFHQAGASSHQWNSFYYFHLAFNPRDLYYRGLKKPQILFHRNSLSGTNRASCLLVIWSNLVIQIPNRELDSWLQHLLTAVTGF